MKLACVVVAASCVACAADPHTVGSATVILDGVQIGTSAWLAPITEDDIDDNDPPTYAGWEIVLSSSAPGAACQPIPMPNDIGAVQLFTATSSPTEVALPVDVAIPFGPVIGLYAVGSIEDDITSGSVTITSFAPDRIAGSLVGMVGSASTTATFTALPCD